MINLSNPMSDTDKPIEVTKRLILFQIAKVLILKCSFLSYYIFSYVDMKSGERTSTLGKVFLAYILCCSIGLFISVLDITQRSTYIGCRITKALWKRVRWVNRFPISILKLHVCGVLITGYWIASATLPVEDGTCGVTSFHACKSMKIITVSVMFITFVLGILILCCLLAICINFKEIVSALRTLCCTCTRRPAADTPPAPATTSTASSPTWLGRLWSWVGSEVQDANPIPTFVSDETECAL